MAYRHQTRTPDGRFELRYRHKDEWGDFSIDERDWTLIEVSTGRTLRSWHHDDDNDVLHVRFSDDFRSVLIHLPGGGVDVFPLPG